MTNELSVEDAIELLKEKRMNINYRVNGTTQFSKALDMAIQALESQRYKPIILQEHDAEPRRLKAILDMKTDNIYILETTKGFAEGMGMTIKEVDAHGSNL